MREEGTTNNRGFLERVADFLRRRERRDASCRGISWAVAIDFSGTGVPGGIKRGRFEGMISGKNALLRDATHLCIRKAFWT